MGDQGLYPDGNYLAQSEVVQRQIVMIYQQEILTLVLGTGADHSVPSGSRLSHTTGWKSVCSERKDDRATKKGHA